MLLRSAVLLSVTLLPVSAIAQAVTFDLVVDNKLSGRDTFTLAKDKHGYKLSSKYHYNVHAVDADFINQYRFSDSYSFVDATTVNNGSTPITISYTPNKPRTEVSVSRAQGGVADSSFFAIKKDFYLLPPFDAGMAQAILLAQAQPDAPQTLSIFSPDPGGVRNPVATDARWIKGPVVSGTLNGAAINAQTYLLIAPGFQWIFYAGDANTLLECDLPAVKTTYVREQFKLTAPPPRLAEFNTKTTP